MTKTDLGIGAFFLGLIYAIINLLAKGVRSTKLAGEKKLNEQDEFVYVTVGTESFPIQKDKVKSWNNFNKNQKFEWIQNVKRKEAEGQITKVTVAGKTMYVATEKGKPITYYAEKYFNDKKYMKDDSK